MGNIGEIMESPVKAASRFGGVLLFAASITPAAAQSVLPAGTYIGAEAGFGIHAGNAVSDVHPDTENCIFCGVDEPLSIGDSAVLGGKLGVRMSPMFRAELDLDYLTSANVKTAFPHEAGSASANLTSLAVFFNGYLDFPQLPPGLLGAFRPFAMAGIGFANEDLGKISGTMGGRPVTISGISRADFAYDIGAGLAYPVAPRLTAELQYRYMDLGSLRGGSTLTANGTATSSSPLKTGSIAVHAVTVGIRYDL